MKKLTKFDVLIVYSESATKSASDNSNDNQSPFPKNSPNETYNIVYGYFLDMCERFDLKAAFTTSADICGPGRCKSYWEYKNKKWIKHNSECFSSLIFDKFSPTRSIIKIRRNLMFSSSQIKPFNDTSLFNLFFDKQKTFKRLAEYAIPTVSLQGKSLDEIKRSCNLLKKLLQKHPYSSDFSSDIVMKDRFGAGGRHVFKFREDETEDMHAVVLRNTNVSYVIQPFTKFDLGYVFRGLPVSADIRLIYLKGKIVQSYVRVAKSGDFRCNEHQGGSLTYVSLSEIPKNLINKSNLIANILNKKCSLFTLDFIVSNNGNPYFLEGNTGPGLDWNMSLKINEIEAKKLIRLIVRELVCRVNVNKDLTKTHTEIKPQIQQVVVAI